MPRWCHWDDLVWRLNKIRGENVQVDTCLYHMSNLMWLTNVWQLRFVQTDTEYWRNHEKHKKVALFVESKDAIVMYIRRACVGLTPPCRPLSSQRANHMSDPGPCEGFSYIL